MLGYVLGSFASLLMIVLVIELLRRERLRERHALWWILFGVCGFVLAAWPGLLKSVSSALGVAIPANLVFFTALVVIFFVALQHGAELTKLESRVRTMAERIAILEMHIGDDGTGPGGRDGTSPDPGLRDGLQKDGLPPTT